MNFTFHPVPPFRLDLTARVLRRVEFNTVDHWDDQEYRRAIVLPNGEAVELIARQQGTANRPRLIVEVPAAGRTNRADLRRQVARMVGRLLGIGVDLREFYELARGVTGWRGWALAEMVKQFRGVKPPRFPSILEALVNGISCQQLSLLSGLR